MFVISVSLPQIERRFGRSGAAFGCHPGGGRTSYCKLGIVIVAMVHGLLFRINTAIVAISAESTR